MLLKYIFTSSRIIGWKPEDPTDVALFLLSPRPCASCRLGAVEVNFKHAENEDQHRQRKTHANTAALKVFHAIIRAFDLAQGNDSDGYLA